MGYGENRRTRGQAVVVREDVFGAAKANSGQWGTTDVGGITEGTYKDDLANGGKETVITKDGAINAAAVDHGGLGGLADDDHTRYAQVVGRAGENLTVQGNLIVEGTTTTVDSETVMVSDNHLFLNNGYVTDAAQTGGLVVNYDPDAATVDTVADAFVAGVVATSNPTVTTTGSDTFAASDIIQISGSTSNDGLFEVLTHTGTTLTIRGIGLTATVEDFTQNQFTAETGAGAITKVAVSVLRAGTDGVWESASGSATTLTFSNIASFSDNLSVFAATTSAQLAGVISDETGSGLLVFGTSPVIVTPDIDGGTVDGVTIGGAAAGAITGTTVVGTTSVSAGTTAAVPGILNARQDQNANTFIRLENATDDTGAHVTVSLSAGTGGTAVTGGVVAYSAGFTPATGKEADSVELTSFGGSNGVILRTHDAAPIKFKPNQVESAQFPSGGGFLVGRTTLFGADDICDFQLDQNGVTLVTCINETDDTAAGAAFVAVQGAGGTQVFGGLRVFSTSFTPATGFEAGAVHLTSGGAGAEGIIVVTGNAKPVKWKPNATLEMELASGGGLDLENKDMTYKGSLDSAAVADEVSIGGYDIGAGNRVLAISQETVVAADADETKFSNKMQVRINGVSYFVMLTTT